MGRFCNAVGEGIIMPKRIEHTYRGNKELKRCCSCKRWLPLDIFYKYNNTWDGLGRMCKKCNNDRQKRYREKHPGKDREKSRRYRERNPDSFKKSKKKYRESEKGKKTKADYYEKYKASGKAAEAQKQYYQKNKTKTEFMERIRKSNKKSYHKNKHKHVAQNRARGKQRTQEIKKRCMSGYCDGIPKCQICGITDIEVLTIDHIYGGGNRLRTERKERTGTNLHFDLIKKEFPEGYQVLCFNCNHKKSLGSRGKKASDEQISHYIQ